MSKNVGEGLGHNELGKGRQSNSTSTQRVDAAKSKNQDRSVELAGRGQAFDGQRQSAHVKQMKQMYSQKGHVQSSP